MSWVATGVAVGSAIIGSRSASDAADAQVQGSQASIQEQRRQYDLTRRDLAPYRTVGTQALNALGSIYGYSPYQEQQQEGGDPRIPINAIDFDRVRAAYGGTVPTDIYEAYYGSGGGTNLLGGQSNEPQVPQSQAPQEQPDYSAFFASPDYEFRRSEGQRDIGNSFAARGGAASGNALRALAQYNSNLAAGEFGNYFNRQGALAGIGQTATNTGAAYGAQTAANVGNLLGQQGNARASGILGQNAALMSGVGGAVDAWSNRRRRFDNSRVGPYGW